MAEASSAFDLSVVRDGVSEPKRTPSLVELIQRTVRFSLPPDARVAVVTEGKPGLLYLEGRQTWPVPRNKQGVYAGQFPKDDGEAIVQVETARSEGAQFLLIPKTALWWLDYYEGLRRHLTTSYRIAFRDEERCLIFALHKDEDPSADEGAPDGLPLPPPETMAMTTGSYWVKAFWESGLGVSRAIRKILSANGLEIGSFGTVLDFGCGCGRVMRHWKEETGPRFFGADYNPYLIDWCRHALRFADFQRVLTGRPLQEEDETFDFIYTFSVFTHLDLETQLFWMSELQRVLKPGGFMYHTFRGARYAEVLSPEERERFDAGEMVVQAAMVSGSNACLAHHPESFIREVLAPELSVVDFVPAEDEVPGGDQVALDGVLFRKSDAVA